MTHDRSARPPGERTDADFSKGVVQPSRWSRIVVVWLGWTSWEPWKSIHGVDLQQTTKKTREEEERAAKRLMEGKMKGNEEFIGLKILVVTSRRRAIRNGEVYLRSGLESFTTAYPIVEKR